MERKFSVGQKRGRIGSPEPDIFVSFAFLLLFGPYLSINLVSVFLFRLGRIKGEMSDLLISYLSAIY